MLVKMRFFSIFFFVNQRVNLNYVSMALSLMRMDDVEKEKKRSNIIDYKKGCVTLSFKEN